MDPPQLELRGPEKSFSDFSVLYRVSLGYMYGNDQICKGTALSTKSSLEDNSLSESLCSASAGIGNARPLGTSLC